MTRYYAGPSLTKDEKNKLVAGDTVWVPAHNSGWPYKITAVEKKKNGAHRFLLLNETEATEHWTTADKFCSIVRTTSNPPEML